MVSGRESWTTEPDLGTPRYLTGQAHLSHSINQTLMQICVLKYERNFYNPLIALGWSFNIQKPWILVLFMVLISGIIIYLIGSIIKVSVVQN